MRSTEYDAQNRRTQLEFGAAIGQLCEFSHIC